MGVKYRANANEPWRELDVLRGPKGDKGDKGERGERGEAGAGLVISGSVATYADLPNNLTISDAGEAYFVEADGKLYIWSGTAWPANGEGSQFKGDKGDPGKDGYTPVKGVDYFDGEDGYTPVKGKDYFDGKDGTSATHRWNGTVLEITSASGTSSADLKGATGDAGYTPQKGVDYFDGKDGQDGYTPQKGVDYFDGVDGKDGASGKDGVSATHSWSGTVLTVTSASGTSSADLKGEKGDTGEVDYSRLDGYLSKSVYDPQGKAQDVFKYVDDAVGNIPTPDVSVQIDTHNGDPNAHASIRKSIADHIGDTIKHITAAERTKWGAMLPASQKGAAGGVASLGNDGKVLAGQLPATMTPAAHKASHMTGGSDALSPSDIGAAAKASIVTATLAANGWSNGAYILTVSGVTATSNQELLPAVDITAEQLEALQAANIQDGGQAAGNITLKAYGDVPTIDIPIRVIKRGD